MFQGEENLDIEFRYNGNEPEEESKEGDEEEGEEEIESPGKRTSEYEKYALSDNLMTGDEMPLN